VATSHAGPFVLLDKVSDLDLVHTSVQVDEDVDGSDDDFGGDEDDDDPFEVFACRKEKVSTRSQRIVKGQEIKTYHAYASTGLSALARDPQ